MVTKTSAIKAGKAVKTAKVPPKKFAEGLGYQKLCVIFIIGCVLGDIYEVVLNFCMHGINEHEIFIERRSATLYGPFSVIYGMGAVVLAKCLAERDLKWWQLFIRGALICGISEIVIGYLQIWFTGTSSWNYSDHWLSFAHNLSSPKIIFLWGIVAVIFIKVFYPLICKLIDHIPPVLGSRVLNIFMIFLLIDMLLSFSAVVRWNFRYQGSPPLTPYGQFLDSAYPNDYMKKAYPNMEFVE